MTFGRLGGGMLWLAIVTSVGCGRIVPGSTTFDRAPPPTRSKGTGAAAPSSGATTSPSNDGGYCSGATYDSEGRRTGGSASCK